MSKAFEKILEELYEIRDDNSYAIADSDGSHYPIVFDDIEKCLKALEIISQNFRLVGNCLHAKNEYAKDGWVFVKEIEDEEELEAWKKVLL